MDLFLNSEENTALRGSETALGLGSEFFFNALAVELSTTQRKPNFDAIDFGGGYRSPPRAVSADMQAVNLILTWYAGAKNQGLQRPAHHGLNALLGKACCARGEVTALAAQSWRRSALPRPASRPSQTHR